MRWRGPARQCLALAASLAFTASGVPSAWAEESAQDTREEIVVTGIHSPRSAALIPVSTSVFDSATIEATHVHRLLQALLGIQPPEYHHHRLITDAVGRRLSKRDQDVTIRSLREANYTPEEVRAMTGFEG